MEYEELIRERYSVRKFRREKVEQEKVEKILQAGAVAPTACNKQPQHIYVIQSKEMLAKLRKCTSSHFHCTLAMLICYDSKESWVRGYDKHKSGEVDATIVTTQMMLEAHSLGVGSTWVMHFNPEAIREEFSMPNQYEPVSILVMGYPAEDAAPSPSHSSKKELCQTVTYL